MLRKVDKTFGLSINLIVAARQIVSGVTGTCIPPVPIVGRLYARV
jgi:hypothetical protein